MANRTNRLGIERAISQHKGLENSVKKSILHLHRTADRAIAYKVSDDADVQATADDETGNPNTPLSLPVRAGKEYLFEAHLLFESSATAGVKVTTQTVVSGVPSTCTGTLDWFRNSYTATGPATTGVAGQGTTVGGVAVLYDAAGADPTVTLQGTLKVTGTGNLVLNYAQNTGDASATYMKAGSWIALTEIAETR